MEGMKFDSEQQDKEEMLRGMYHEINSLQRAVHEHNQKWIHSGLRTMFIVPWLFMFLMFWAPSSSKLVFLVLWIVSMFIIAVFLIGVEYSDYLLQKKWISIIGGSQEEIQSLSVMPPAGPIAEAVKDRKEKRFDYMDSAWSTEKNRSCLEGKRFFKDENGVLFETEVITEEISSERRESP